MAVPLWRSLVLVALAATWCLNQAPARLVRVATCALSLARVLPRAEVSWWTPVLAPASCCSQAVPQAICTVRVAPSR